MRLSLEAETKLEEEDMAEVDLVQKHELLSEVLNKIIEKSRDDSGYGLTGYGSYKFVTSYTFLTVYYCNRSNLALCNQY